MRDGYALFTLVGIAGEDDLDAPALIAPAGQAAGHSASPAGQGTRRGGNGSAVGVTLHDDIVPVRLKALLEESDSIEVQQQALDLATTHIEERERNEFEALEEAIPDLIRLERYERRAWSLQQRALREFMNIKLMRMMARN